MAAQVAGALEIQMMMGIARLQSDMTQAKGVVGRGMNAIESSVAMAKRAFDGLGIAMRAAVGALGARELISLTDQYTKFTAQLRLATGSASEYSKAMIDVRRIAKDAQSELGATGVLYARIARGTEELGLSQSKLSKITETVSLALKASGATSAESASAMLQLSQAFGSGVLRGQEFNAVNEAAPRLMKALADGMGVPVGRLREMAEAGKITSAVMAEALPKALEELRKEAATVQTIAGAFQVLKNNILEFVGENAQASGSVAAITGLIGALANNLTLLAGAILSVMASKFTQWLASSTVAVYASVTANHAATLAALATAEANAVAATSTFTAAAAATSRTAALVVEANAQRAMAAEVMLFGPQRAAIERQVTAAVVAHTAAVQAQALAETQATLATSAHAKAMAAASVSGRAVAAGTTVLGGALALLGGPIGAITLALGLGATAWAVWGNAAKNAGDEAKTAIQNALLIAKQYEKEAKYGAGNVGTLRAGIEAIEKRIALLGQTQGAGAAALLLEARGQLTALNAAIEVAKGIKPPAKPGTTGTVDEAAMKKALAEAERYRKLDADGWVKHIDAKIDEYEKELKEFAMLADEKAEIDRRQRAADIAGHVASAEAIVQANFEQAQQLARDQIAAAERADEAKKRLDENRLREQERQAEEIDRLLGDAIMHGFERGEGFAENFWTSMVNMAKTVVLRPIISAVMSPVTGAITSGLGAMGFSGLTNAAGSAAGAGLVGSVGGWMGTAAAGAPVTSTIGAVASGAGYAGAGSTGMMGTLAAIPGWGWAALGAAAIGAYILNSGDEDAQRTGNWSARLGQVGGSTQNKWFDSSTGAGPFAAELAASERAIAELLKLNTTQIDIIDTKLASLAGRQYGFGMERTDWMESGAAQAIAADRLRAIAESLGLSVEALAQKMADAQKQIDLAPQKLQLEIDLMKLQGKEAEALAAERKRELAALDPLLHGLQKQIYAAQDLAAAANDAAGAVNALAQQIDDVQKAAGDAVDAQLAASRSASQAARQAADAYRQVGASLADAVAQIVGGGRAVTGARLDAVFNTAMTENMDALSSLPKVAQDYLAASKATSRTAADFARDQAKVVDMLNQAQLVSTAMVNWNEYQATLLETQTGVLEAIKEQLSLPSPDAAILTQQMDMLSTIAQLLQEQTTQVIAGNTITIDQTGKIATGNALVGTQTGQIISGNATQDVIKNISSLNTSYSEEMLKALVIGGTTQADSLQGIVGASDLTVSLLRQLVSLTEQKTAQDQAAAAAAAAAEQRAAADRLLQQQVSQATAAFEAEKSVVGALRTARDAAVANLGVSQAPAAFTQENLATGTPSGYEYFTYFVGQEALVGAAKQANAAYMAAVAQAYELYKAIPGHAGGGLASGWSMVGERGPELVNFTQPGRVYTADQTRGMLSGSANDEVVAELRALRQQNERMQARLDAMGKDTRKTAETLTRVTRDGESLVTVAA